MISNFNEEAEDILVKAKLEMLELKHPYIGTEHLVLAILHTKNELTEKLEKYHLNYTNFKKEIINIIGKGSKKSNFFLHTPLLKKVIEGAIIDSKENNNGIVTVNHLFSSLLDVGEGIAIRIFISMNIDIDEIYNELSERIYNPQKNKKLLIEELGINLNERAKNNEIDPVIGREKEIKKLEEILCRRTKNNPLLIGEPGVGKTAIVEGLANLIEKNEIPNKLMNKKIISLDMASAVAGTKYRGEFEERMKKIIDEISNNNEIILFIDEIHTLIGAGGAEGAIDASNILKPALARGKIRCIGATTSSEYQKHFEKDKALERRFQTIIVEEPTIEETKKILYELKPIYERHHNVSIKKDVIDAIIELTEKYFYDRFRPDKQIDILDEVCSKVSIDESYNITNYNKNIKKLRNKKKKYIENKDIKKAYEYKLKETKLKYSISKLNNIGKVTNKDVATVISSKTNIPIYEILKESKRSIVNIERKLKEEIIGQEKAIKNLIDITKRIKFGYRESKCISILLYGPCGCGKTKLATVFGKLISNQQIIEINMCEYADISSISKFIGTNAGYIGYEDNNYILNKIKENPNAVIVLDEIEKANSKIINIIYQMIDEGKIKDAKNNTIILNNNTIIMTTNTEENTSIGFNLQETKNELMENFTKTFINKITNIIKIEKLNEKSIQIITNKELSKIKEKYQNINIYIDNDIIEEIVKTSEYQSLGAKNIKNIITEKIENKIIDSIIENKKEININTIFA